MAEIKCTGTMIAMDEMYNNPKGYCVIDEHGISILYGNPKPYEYQGKSGGDLYGDNTRIHYTERTKRG